MAANQCANITLRHDLRPGDIGWIVERHGLLYATEFGWNIEFEIVVAEIVAEVAKEFDPTRTGCWIAERDGERVGCVFIEPGPGTFAKLRLLLVEPDARGIGLGRRLVDECIRFAREAGYSGITIWTMHILAAARHTYEQAGFRLVAAEPGRHFGHDLVSETWELVF